MTLGEKLQLLRRSRGLSQEQLAERLDVSRQAVSKWENDDSAPDLDKLRAICMYFGVTTDYLIWERQEDAPQSTETGQETLHPAGGENLLRTILWEHGEWIGYAIAILGAALLLRTLPGMIVQLLMLIGGETDWSIVWTIAAMYLPHLAVYGIVTAGGLLLARWWKKRREANDDL